MKRNKARFRPFNNIGIEEKLMEEPKLASWAKHYVKEAVRAGEKLENWSEDEARGSPVSATISLVCDIWQYSESSEWLSWQTYGGPRGRGPWWIATFDTPQRWNCGTMLLQNPWNFAFSHLYISGDDPSVQFSLHTSRNAPISRAKQNWLARAVMDGIRWDCDDSEFALVCTRHQRSLGVNIWHPDMLEHNSGGQYKKDADGILWHQGPWT